MAAASAMSARPFGAGRWSDQSVAVAQERDGLGAEPRLLPPNEHAGALMKGERAQTLVARLEQQHCFVPMTPRQCAAAYRS